MVPKTIDPFPLIDPDGYRRLCSQFATGVAVATTIGPTGDPHGLTISSFTAVSIEPPLILICIDNGCPYLEHFVAGPYFAVNVLSGEQRDLSVRFSERPEGRFDGVEWTPGATASPLVGGALAAIECRLERVVEAGDHAVLFGAVLCGEVRDASPLLYFNRTYRRLG